MSLKTCLQVPALTRDLAFQEPTLPHSPAPTLPPSEETYAGSWSSLKPGSWSVPCLMAQSQGPSPS